MATQYNMNTYQEQWTILENIQAKKVTGVEGGDMEFPRVLKNMEIPGVN